MIHYRSVFFVLLFDPPNLCFSRVLELKGSQLIGKADIVHNLTSTALLLMPLFKRGTLHDALQRRAARSEPFSNQEALRLFLQVSANGKYRQRTPPDPRGHYKQIL